MYENKTDKHFFFKIFMNKKPILIGQKVASRSACIQNIEKTLSSLKSNTMISVRATKNKGFVFTIAKTESVIFKSLELASDGLAYLKELVDTMDRFTVSFDTFKQKVAVKKKKLTPKKPKFNLQQVSKTKKAGFELLDKKKRYSFHFNDAKGKPFLYSRIYTGSTKRTKAAKKLTTLIKKKNQITTDITVVKQGVYALIKEKNGTPIARTKVYKNRKKLEKAITYFKKTASSKAKILQLPKKKKKTLKLPKERYLLKQKAPLAEVGFEGFKDAKNKFHYFHFYDKKGKALLYSPPFTAQKKRDKAIQTLIQLSKNKRLYEMKKKSEQHFFILLDETGKDLARSRSFSTKTDMIKGMRYFHTHAHTYREREEVEMIPITETIVIKLDEKRKPATTNSDKTKNIPDSSKVKQLNTVAMAAKPVVNGTGNKEQKSPTTKVAKNGHSPSATSSKPVTKQPTKSIPLKSKAPPAEADKKNTNPQPDNLKKTTTKPITTKKILPPLKEVDKTSRVSTRTQATRKSPINKEARKKGLSKRLPKKHAKVDTNAPPRIQPRSEEQPTINWWWLPVILVAALLLYGLFKLFSGLMYTESVVPPVEPIKKEVVKPIEESSTLLGPTATELGFEKGSLSAKVTDFLSLPKSVFPETFLLDKVHFPSNQEIITEAAQQQLDRIVQILKAYPTVTIQINGHTDNVGNGSRNLVLSESRAAMVKDYLKRKGINIERINSKGFGANRPLTSNDTEEGRKTNRRSEIVLLKR